MANKKFSEFDLKTVSTDVDFIVGYTGTDNVRIDPANIGGGGNDFTALYTSNFYASANTATSFYFMPFMGSSSEGTSGDQQKAIVCPYDGYVSFMQMKNVATQGPTSTSTEFDIARDTGTGNNPTYTSIYNSGSISHSAVRRFEITDTLSSTDASFSAGDILYIRYKTDGLLYRIAFTAVFVFQP